MSGPTPEKHPTLTRLAEAAGIELAHILTVDEVARMMRVDQTAVTRWAREGVLPALRVGALWRFEADALEEFLSVPRVLAPAGSTPVRITTKPPDRTTNDEGQA